ncbi:MAG: hypothetical protein ACU0BK_05420 [Shimia sp.]|uniref:hypothetical protein n=1 Tax=Shimia sp. TaxID=1954381 RepID=UPI004058C283
MKALFLRLSFFAACSFAVMFALAFTPLSILPFMLSIPVLAGWAGFEIMAFLLCTPLGGLIPVVIFSKPERRMNNTFGLAGLWIGTILGSATGIKYVGTL